MSLVERNDFNLVVKSYTVHLVGQAIVHITTEPCIDHQASDIHSATTYVYLKLLRLHFDLVIFVSNGVSNIAVANGASSCNNISLILILLRLEPAHKLLQGHTPFQYQVSTVFQPK